MQLSVALAHFNFLNSVFRQLPSFIPVTSVNVTMGRQSKKKDKRNIATSDPDKSKGNSPLFKAILKNTCEAGSNLFNIASFL